jgi:amino acid transporter
MQPFSEVWSNVNARTATPVYTIIAVGIFFAIIINLLSGGFVTNVLAVVNVALYLTYGSTCLAVLIGVRRGSLRQRRSRPRPRRRPGGRSRGSRRLSNPVAHLV